MLGEPNSHDTVWSRVELHLCGSTHAYHTVTYNEKVGEREQ